MGKYPYEFLPDATNFDDMPIMPRETCLAKGNDVILCPVCKGHGGWNLRLKAYRDGGNFQASCGQCNGWGWVEKDGPDATCVHEYRELSDLECRERNIHHFGMCWHVYTCEKCGHIISQDSSG